ncbi:MAG: phosphoglycerate kinase [Acidobacteriota bacterium]
MGKKSIEKIDVSGKMVFLRNDFNVPIFKTGEITDDSRITASLKTIRHLLENGAKVVCSSHLGRPGGVKKEELTLRTVAEKLSQLIGVKVIFNGEITGDEVDNIKSGMKPGEIFLLENLRFDPREKANNDEFGKELAKGIDIYVNDAFGSSHRKHASISAITKYIPVSAAGFLLKQEIDFLGMAITNPPENFTLILGGAKVSDKIPIIKNLIKKTDTILIGGAMAYTFLKAKGIDIGKSLVEEDLTGMCKDIIEEAENKGVKLLLPVDHIAAIKAEPNITIRMVNRGEEIPPEMMGLDIGFETQEIYKNVILKSNLIIWNGPMGVFEIDTFSGGTFGIAEAVAESEATSIVGGGDSVSAVNLAAVNNKITHISTGGGASIKFLAGEIMPGIENLPEE